MSTYNLLDYLKRKKLDDESKQLPAEKEWYMFFHDMLTNNQKLSMFEKRLEASKINSFLVSVFALAGSVLSTYETTMYLDVNQETVTAKMLDAYGKEQEAKMINMTAKAENSVNLGLRLVVTLTTAITSRFSAQQVYLIIKGETIKKELLVINEKWHRMVNLKEVGMLYPAIAKCVYIGMHNLPGVNFLISASQNGFPFTYNSNFIFTIIALNRCVFLINLIVVFSDFNEMVMKHACNKFKIRFTYSLTLRCLLKSIPYIVTGILLFSFLFVFSYVLVNFEYPNSLVSGQNWKTLANGFWNTIITMTTVGYGDLFATTNFGRMTAVAIMIWGAFINSMILVAMQISAAFSPQEQSAYENIQYMTSFKDVQESALLYLKSYLYVRCINRKAPVSRDPNKLLEAAKKRDEDEDTVGYEERMKETTLARVKEVEEQDASEKQNIFNQLTILQKREWYGKLRKYYVDVKNKRKMFQVDNSKLDIDKEIEVMLERFERMILFSNAYTKNIEEVNGFAEQVLKKQDVIDEKLAKIGMFIEGFSDQILLAKKNHDAIYDAYEKLSTLPQVFEKEVKNLRILENAKQPSPVTRTHYINYHLMKLYSEEQLRQKIKEAKLDPNSLMSRNSHNSLKSEISGNSGEEANNEKEFTEEYWGGPYNLEDDDDRLNTSMSTVMKGEDSDGSDDAAKAVKQNEALMGNILDMAGNMQVPEVEKKQTKKKKKKDNTKVRVLGVEPVKEKRTLDQFGHLEDSDSNVNTHGFDDVINFMRVMNVQIAHQKETHGNNLKSNLKPRVGAKDRGYRVKWHLDGIVVKDENTAKKMLDKTDKFIKEDDALTVRNGVPGATAGGSALTDSELTLHPGAEGSQRSGSTSSSKGSRKKLLDDDNEEDLENLDEVERVKRMVLKKYTGPKKVPSVTDDLNSTGSSWHSSKTRSQSAKNKAAKNPMLLSTISFTTANTDVTADYDVRHESDEEIKNLKKIAKQKELVIGKEKEKIAPLVAQQQIAGDFRKNLEGKKEFFVEIANKNQIVIEDDNGTGIVDNQQLMAGLTQRYESLYSGGKGPAIVTKKSSKKSVTASDITERSSVSTAATLASKLPKK